MLYPELAELGWERDAHRRGARRGAPAALAPCDEARRAHTFLAGAGSRLLPASIPFRFFGAACVFHVLAWLALAADADALPRFAGGLGWPLAALHLLTLGVLVMTAIGASLQLLPVATRQPIRAPRVLAAVWWLYTPGVALLALGMGTRPRMAAGGRRAAGIATALAGVRRAACGATCAARAACPPWWRTAGSRSRSLAILLASALSLACAYVGVPVLARAAALALHVAVRRLRLHGDAGARPVVHRWCRCSRCPPAPDERRALASLRAGRARAAARRPPRSAGSRRRRCASPRWSPARWRVALHLRLMAVALRTGMRRELGRSFTLVRVGWALPRRRAWSPALASCWTRRSPACATLFGAAADRRLAAQLPARHAAAHRAVPGVDARGARPRRAADAVAR